MALHWNLEPIENYEEVCFISAPADDPGHDVKQGDKILNPVTNALIWATIGVDIGRITSENAAEFYARLNFIENLDGPLLIRNGGEGPQNITPEEVHAHIGLTCNVVNKTRSQWLRRFQTDLDRKAGRYESAVDALHAKKGELNAA